MLRRFCGFGASASLRTVVINNIRLSERINPDSLASAPRSVGPFAFFGNESLSGQKPRVCRRATTPIGSQEVFRSR